MNEKLRFTKERLMKVLLAPCLTEKAAMGSENRQYLFKVLRSATKPQIKEAVEFLFAVKVDAVQVSNVKGKVKRHGRIEGERSNWKKAYVKLSEGHKIEFTGA